MQDLKCTITITGKEGSEGVSVTAEFDPVYTEDGAFEDSGVGRVASTILGMIAKIATGPSYVTDENDNVEEL